MGHRRDIQIQKTAFSAFCGTYNLLFTLPPPEFLPCLWPAPCTLQHKVSMKVSERSQRVTVPEYCILRVGGYTKLGTSRSLKMVHQVPDNQRELVQIN
ncbi:hypothetical protein T4E_6758 [Trichinella pseudospiralis]|uniref:Uncharacterized protein n=1 Tax=Trichinella pseudospiralis TaxID=6337 RepID=A0A0V0XXC5_TRIPS|nr:hypothetical protein T4E_6758 [Trichinella pseudospiralis]